MLINPEEALKSGWITHPDCNTYDDYVERKYVSPNAIDFPLDALSIVDTSDSAYITEASKKLADRTSIPSSEQNDDIGSWFLRPTELYDGWSSMMLNLPKGVVCELIIRSTFNRNGIFLTSGLYDSGYQGHIGFMIHVRGGNVEVGKHTRIGQIKFIQSDSLGMYAGGYNHKEGTTWSEECVTPQ